MGVFIWVSFYWVISRSIHIYIYLFIYLFILRGGGLGLGGFRVLGFKGVCRFFWALRESEGFVCCRVAVPIMGVPSKFRVDGQPNMDPPKVLVSKGL